MLSFCKGRTGEVAGAAHFKFLFNEGEIVADAFLVFYRQLSRATVFTLWVAVGLLLAAISAALLGFADAVIGLRQSAIVVGVAFVALFAILALAYLVDSAVRWINRRRMLDSGTTPQ